MDEKILIKLLQMQLEHQRKVNQFTGKLNVSLFEIDLLSVVLDAVGVPADNTLEQIGKYGYGDWLDRPDTFTRYEYYREFEKRVQTGAEAELKVYLEHVILVSTFQQLLNGSKIESVLIDS